MTEVERRQAEGLERLIDDPNSIPTEPDPAIAADLTDLVVMAAELRRGLAPEPASAATRARLWTRLQHRMRADPEPGRGWLALLRPATALAAAALAVTLALATTVAAAEAALPGDALYSVKRGLEAARLALSADDDILTANFADRRLEEIEELTAHGRWDDTEAALAQYTQGVESLAGVEPASVEGQLERHLEVLVRVRSQAPVQARAGLDRAIERTERSRQEARDREADKGPPPEAPGQEKKESGASGTPGPRYTPRRPGGLPPGWEKKLTPTP